jgi:prophage regulatory protein
MTRVPAKSRVQHILRLPAVLAATGWSRSTLYLKITNSKFPAPIKLDPEGRAVGWPEDDVLAYQQARISAGRSVAERDPPLEPVKELWAAVGRRGGKDSVASVIAAHTVTRPAAPPVKRATSCRNR